MPKERCEEQGRLALAAVAATNRVYGAKNALDAARKGKLASGSVSSSDSRPTPHSRILSHLSTRHCF